MDNGLGHIVNRNEIHGQIRFGGDHPEPPCQIEPEGEIQGVKGFNGAGTSVADNHPWSKD